MSTMWQTLCDILCDILLQYHLNVKMFAILILQILMLQGGGDNSVHRKILEWEKLASFGKQKAICQFYLQITSLYNQFLIHQYFTPP